MRFRLLTTLVLAGVAASLLVTGPAGAGGSCPPAAFPDADGLLSAGGTWFGDNIYNGQFSAKPADPGQTVTWKVKYENERNKPRGITIRALPDTGDQDFPGSFRIKYFRGDVDVTSSVNASGYKFTGVAPGAATPALRIEVKRKSGAPSSHFVLFEVMGNYGAGGCGDILTMRAGAQ